MKFKVSSKSNSFRRAGFAFTREPREIEVDEKIADALKGEPMLVVEEMEEPHPHPAPLPEGEGTKNKGKGK